MGGEMMFHHHDKPISNLADYEKLVQDIVNDCKNQVVPVEFNLDKPTEILTEEEKQDFPSPWRGNLGADKDYIVGITLQKNKNGYGERRFRNDHYYILFPKDPNTFKVISWMHARGFGGIENIKRWIHDSLTKLEKTFPDVFDLDYFDGYSGVGVEYDNYF